MLRCLALSLACLLLFPTVSRAAKLEFTCTITFKDTGTTDRRTVQIDTVARSVRDKTMITIDGAANAIAKNQVEFVDISDDRIAWGSRLRTTSADVLVIAIDLHTGRYTFTSHLRGLRADGTCEATSGAT